MTGQTHISTRGGEESACVVSALGYSGLTCTNVAEAKAKQGEELGDEGGYGKELCSSLTYGHNNRRPNKVRRSSF